MEPAACPTWRLPALSPDGPFAFCVDKFLLEAPADAETVRCDRLLDPVVLGGIMDRYARSFDADRRAAVSVWTLYYFSLLTITPTVFRLMHRHAVALDLDAMWLVLDPATGRPEAFVLDAPGGPAQDASVVCDLHVMLRDHAARLVPALSAAERVSPKLLWNNLVVYFHWALTELAKSEAPELAGRALALVEAPDWPDGSRNPLHGLLREGCRKVCCLRYILPGVAGCGSLCPLPNGRS